jgi:integrase
MKTTNHASKNEAQIKVNSGYLRIQLPRYFYEGQQKYLSLNLLDTPENQIKAKVILAEIQRDINYDKFDTTLEKYRTNSKDKANISNESQPQHPTFKEMLDNFESKYFRNRKKSRASNDTFCQTKQSVIRLFKEYESFDFCLSKEVIDKAIYSLKAGTASRTKSVDFLKVFLKCFKFDYQFRKGITSSYEPKHRSLPTDEEIIEAWHKIKVEGKCYSVEFRGNAESWGWIFAVIATYGLRSHEVLAIDYKRSFKPPYFPLYIDEKITGGTKTGSRIVLPLPLEWVELFDIANPKTQYIEETERDFKTKIRLFADSVGERIKNKGIIFRAYDMRHRYAIRGRELGFEIDILAKWMGHTVKKHTEIYQKYMTNDSHTLIYEEGLSRKFELEKIKQGEFSYSELEIEIEKAKLRIAKLQAELELISKNKEESLTNVSKSKKSAKSIAKQNIYTHVEPVKRQKKHAARSDGPVQLNLFEGIVPI